MQRLQSIGKTAASARTQHLGMGYAIGSRHGYMGTWSSTSITVFSAVIETKKTSPPFTRFQHQVDGRPTVNRCGDGMVKGWPGNNRCLAAIIRMCGSSFGFYSGRASLDISNSGIVIGDPGRRIESGQILYVEASRILEKPQALPQDYLRCDHGSNRAPRVWATALREESEKTNIAPSDQVSATPLSK
ncbi:hypothetical protein PM082_012129 [Marasmius tenuissimus]|nr:hypothetical protein PM082_012129 [Marasmius tenuissimus]